MQGRQRTNRLLGHTHINQILSDLKRFRYVPRGSLHAGVGSLATKDADDEDDTWQSRENRAASRAGWEGGSKKARAEKVANRRDSVSFHRPGLGQHEREREKDLETA
jgi:hypothetical protein